MSNRAHEFARQATAVTIAAADTDVTANAAATTSNLMTYSCANDVTEAADVMTHANNLTRRPTRLRPGSKWRVAQKMIGLMDSNRASNEKQDMADIVKMFQRLNAKKIFDNLNAAGALSDINTDVLNMPTAATKFEGLEAARAKLADTRYDSVDIERSFTEQLDDHRKDTKGHLELMNPDHVFDNITEVLEQGQSVHVQYVRKLTRQESQNYIGDVDTSSLFGDLDRAMQW